MLSRECALYVNDFIHSNPEFTNFFLFSANADEIFFQTIILNSHLKDKVRSNDLTYTDWSPNASHPKILNKEDLESLKQSSCLFARKFDIANDPGIFDLIDQEYISNS